MKRICFLLAIIFCLAARAEAQTTYTATASGNWNATTTWSSGTIPVGGSPSPSGTVNLAGFTVTMNVNTIPSSGTLAMIMSSSAASGKITLAEASGQSYNINAANSIGSNSTGILNVTGTGGTLNIGGSVSGGTGTQYYALYHAAGGVLNISGSVSAGSATGAYGVYILTNSAAYTVGGGVSGNTTFGLYFSGITTAGTINGQITGGTNSGAEAVDNNGTVGASLTVNGALNWPAGQNAPIVGLMSLSLGPSATFVVNGSTLSQGSSGATGNATSADVWSGVTFSSSSGTGTGVLTVSASNIRAGNTVHGVSGTCPSPAPFGAPRPAPEPDAADLRETPKRVKP